MNDQLLIDTPSDSMARHDLDQGEDGNPLGSKILAIAFTIWLSICVAGPYALNASGMAETVVAVSVIIPFAAALITGFIGKILNMATGLLCAALVVPASISCALGYVDMATIFAIAILPLYVFSAAAVAHVPPEMLKNGLRIVALVTLATLILSTISHGEMRFLLGKFAVWERLTAGRHPNYLGLTALVGMIACMAWGGFVRLALAFAFLWLTYLAQSRMTLSSMGVCLVAIGIQCIPPLLNLARRVPKLAPAIILAFVALSGGVVVVGVKKVLYLSSLGGRDVSDMGGRTRIWKIALDTFSNAPVFGYGYRSQSSVNLLGEYYSHNMWLSALVEIGTVGTVSFLLIYIFSIYCAIRHIHENPIMPICLVTLLAYLIYGIGEGRYINTGNPLSVIFLLAAVYAITIDQSVRRMAEANADSRSTFGRSGLEA